MEKYILCRWIEAAREANARTSGEILATRVMIAARPSMHMKRNEARSYRRFVGVTGVRQPRVVVRPALRMSQPLFALPLPQLTGPPVSQAHR